MTRTTHLTALADAVLMPCFDGTTAPDWLLRRVHESIGAVCLFARNIGTPEQVRSLTAALRAARPDVVIAIDEEAGDVTRLDASTGSPFPGNAALGRVDDVRLTRSVGYQVGLRLRDVGVNLNFAPCADVASDPANPVIGARSFGNDPKLVARHTTAFIAGQQAAGVGACAKHFPGHGDTDADTHHRLAVLDGDLERLLADAIPPFTAAIEAGVTSVMAGHLLVPAVDRQPASVSHRWLTDILRGELGFQGVISTDALEMEALAGEYGIAESAVLALIAGADLLCLGGETRPDEELFAISSAIADAVVQGRLAEERLADAARRVGELNGRLAAAQSVATLDSGDPAVSAAVARRALDIAGPLPTWTEPTLVLRCDDRPNIAVGHVPWGPSAVLTGRTDHVLHPTSALPVDEIASAATVVVVTRDRHRHPWMVRTLDAVRADRPDAVLLEMGTTGVRGAQAPAVGSYGATLANTRAALGVLGVPVTEIRDQRDTMTAMEPHQLLDHGGSGAPSPRSADSPRLLREINDQVVLGLLLDRGPMTRGRIGEATGLSKPTVSSLLARLEERGLVTTAGVVAGGPGPNARIYTVDPAAGHVIAVHVEQGGSVAALANLTGEVIATHAVQIPVRRSSSPLTEATAAVDGVLATAGLVRSVVHRVLIATPGVIDPVTGNLRHARHLHGWESPGLAEQLSEILGTPVHHGNDVNLAAVAEGQYGAARGKTDYALVWLDRGVGLGLVLDGRLRSGAHGGAGEIGYLPVPGVTRQRVDRGGAGAFQQLVGGQGLRAMAKRYGVRGTDPAGIVRAALAGNGNGAALIDELAEGIALGTAAVTTLLDPGLVVLGGPVALAGGPVLLEKVTTVMRQVSFVRPQVVLSTVTSDGVLRGAVEVALQTVRSQLFGTPAAGLPAGIIG